MYEVKQLREQLSRLKQERSNLEYEWARVLLLVQPNRSLANSFYRNHTGSTPTSTTRQNEGQIKSIYDNRGATNSAILASYLHSSLTNPHERWMSLLPSDTVDLVDGLKDDTLKQLRNFSYLSKQCSLEWQASNFHQVTYSFYKSLVDIGTACVTYNTIMNSNGKSSLVFADRSMFNVLFQEDAYGFPSTIFCIYPSTAHQLAEFFQVKDKHIFKEKFGGALYRSLVTRDTTFYPLVHAVYPSNLYSSNKSFLSQYFMYERAGDTNVENVDMGPDMDIFDQSDEYKKALSNTFLSSTTIDYNPYIITRIRKTPGEIYGSGFSMECFPLLVQLQQLQRSITIAAQKNTEPPLNIPSNRLKDVFSTVPNHLNSMDILNGQVLSVSPTLKEINLNYPSIVKSQISADIDKTYMIDKIQLEGVGYNRTAQEVSKRSSEEVKILSPFLGSLESEFLTPLVVLTLKHLKEVGGDKIQGILEDLSGADYNIKYVSDIARAQIKSETNDMVELMSVFEKVSQGLSPTARDQIDWDKFATRILLNYNGPFDIVEDKKTIDEKRKAQQQEAAKGNMGADAEAAKKSAEAYTTLVQGEKIRKGF